MTRICLTLISFMLATLCGPLASPVAGQTPVNGYTVVQLPGPANGINDAGQVVGQTGNHASLWQNGVSTDLGALGGASSTAYGINNSGQVVGSSPIAGTYPDHAFLWTSGTGMRDLGTLGGDYSLAYGVNDAGQVVGRSRMTDGRQIAYLWKEGRMYELGTLAGYEFSTAYGINASGQVVGKAHDSFGGEQAFRWTPTVPNGTTGTMVALNSSGFSAAFGINTSGTVVGHANGLPVRWDSSGVVHTLAVLPGYSSGLAYTINDADEMAGDCKFVEYYVDPEGYIYYIDHYTAVVWDSGGAVRDLNALNSVGGLMHAVGINNNGQVVADYNLLNPCLLPPRPRFLSASVGNRRVDLSWEASAGTARYNVKRTTTSGGPYTVVASGVTATSYRDTTVANRTTYYYVVSAVNAYGESNSSEAGATPFLSPPTSPWALGSDHKVTLGWSASPDTNIYNIKRSTTSGGPYTIIASGLTGLGYVDTTAVNGTRYFYRISAASVPDTADSSEVSAMPTALPIAPTNLSASGAIGKVNLKWTQSTGLGIAQNRIYRSTTNGGPYANVAVIGPGTAYTDTAVISRKTYYYRVTAVTINGQESPYANQASASAR